MADFSANMPQELSEFLAKYGERVMRAKEGNDGRTARVRPSRPLYVGTHNTLPECLPIAPGIASSMKTFTPG